MEEVTIKLKNHTIRLKWTKFINLKYWWFYYHYSRLCQSFYITIFGFKFHISKNKKPLSQEQIQELRRKYKKYREENPNDSTFYELKV